MESIPYQLLIAYFLFQLRGILVFLDFLQKYLIKFNTGGNQGKFFKCSDRQNLLGLGLGPIGGGLHLHLPKILPRYATAYQMGRYEP